MKSESPLINVYTSTILSGRDFLNEIREKYLNRMEGDRDLPDLKYSHERPDREKINRDISKAMKRPKGRGIKPAASQ